MKEVIIIIMTSVLTNNYVLFKFMGVCPFLGATNKNRSALYMSLATGAVMILSSAATWAIWNMILLPYNAVYLRTLVFLIIIAVVVAAIDILLKIFKSELAEGMGIYLPLIASNCAVLGLCVNNAADGVSLFTAVMNALGAAIGFAVAMFMMSGVRERIEHSDIPESFRGAPAALISAGIISLSFIGFSGLGVGLFGM